MSEFVPSIKPGIHPIHHERSEEDMNEFLETYPVLCCLVLAVMASGAATALTLIILEARRVWEVRNRDK